MKTRVITSAVGLAVLAVVLMLFDTVVFDLVLAAICLIAIHEIYNAMGFAKEQKILFYLAIPYTMLIMLTSSEAVRGLVLPASFLILLIYNVIQIANIEKLEFGKLSSFLYFSGVVIFSFYSLIYLKRRLPSAEYGDDAIYFILLVLCFAWGGDTAAYFAGRSFGKHKLAPIVSPKKTVEGAIGGVFGSMLAGAIATFIYAELSNRFDAFTVQVRVRHYVIILLMGAIGSVLGILGDLFASVVKRQVGIKDYGTLFPGHGGVLDRFDSVMFIAPLVSMGVRYFFYLY